MATHSFLPGKSHREVWQATVYGTAKESVTHDLATKQFTNLASRTSLVAQTVKHLPTMRETWVQSLGWEDLLEKEMATHSNRYSRLENPIDGRAW